MPVTAAMASFSESGNAGFCWQSTASFTDNPRPTTDASSGRERDVRKDKLVSSPER